MSSLPTPVKEVLTQFYTCEVTTVNREGQPISWPSLPYYDDATDNIYVTASIAFPVKAVNARRNPHVSLLFSDPTGANLVHPPAVRVQGDAAVAEILDYSSPVVGALFRLTKQRQPDFRTFVSNRVMRRAFTWYLYQRLLITVQPRRLLVWSQSDFSAPPTEIEVSHVE